MLADRQRAGTRAAGPIAGFRILDLTRVAAGPYATELLGFLGAEVIRVESASRLDMFRRRVDNPSAGLDQSARFNELNLGKQSIRLNLQKAEGKDLLRRLVVVSDAVVENFRPGVMERLGLGYEQLLEIKPDLVMASISSAGRGGPESSQPGYASIFNALAGLGHLTGYADGPPTEVRDSVDMRVAATAAFAILSALFHRVRTGEGQYVDLSAREATSAVQGDAIVEYGLTGRSPKRDGNRLGLPAPYDVYPCAGDDAWIAIAVGSDVEWRRLLGALGRVDLLHDERFADAVLRDRHRADVDDVVASWTRTRTPTAAAESLLAAGVAATPVLDAHGLVADPHVQSRGIFRTIQHPILGEQTVVGPPWRFRSGLPEVVTGPTFGRDGERIFGDLLGLSPEAIAGLVEREVIH